MSNLCNKQETQTCLRMFASPLYEHLTWVAQLAGQRTGVCVMHITGDKVLTITAIVLLLSILGFLWGLTSQLGRLAADIVAGYVKERVEVYKSWRARSNVSRGAEKILKEERRANMGE